MKQGGTAKLIRPCILTGGVFLLSAKGYVF